MTQRPTLKTISELSGLAVPTVSRALNNAPDISAKTKLRVKEIATKIGYSPDRAGLRLRTGRTNVISIVIAVEHDMMNQTPQMISSVANGLRGTPYHLNVMPFLADEDPLNPIRYIVETGAADAVILNATEPEDERVKYLLDHNFPFVTHGRSAWMDRHAFFDYDNKQFVGLGVKLLDERGVKDVLLIAPPLEQFYALEMCAGGREAAQSLGVNLSIADRITSDSPSNVVREYIRAYLTDNPSTSGIIAGSTNSAMAASKGSEDAGRTIGKTIEIFTKEPLPFLSLFREGLMVFHEDIDRAGDFLARAAMHAIKHPDEPPMQELDVPIEGAVRDDAVRLILTRL